MPKPPESKLTRRSFLQLLVATGGSLLAAGLLRALGTTDRSAYTDHIKNIIVFIQENHSFDSLFAGFPGANSKFSDRECTDSLLRDPRIRMLMPFSRMVQQ